MAEDCEQLSAKAQKIFEKLKGEYPPDPWGKPQWFQEGVVQKLGSPRYDLRKSEDRQKLIDWYEHMIGRSVHICATSYQREYGSLKGFTRQHYSRLIQNWAEILIVLHDLDFQIETLDLVGD